MKYIINKNYTKLFATDTLSFVMNRLLLFVMPLWIMEATKSTITLSLFNSILIVVSILTTPITGTLADRLHKVKILKSGNILKLIVVGLMLIFYFMGHFYIVIGLFFIRYMCISIINPSTKAMLVDIVDKQQMKEAVYKFQITNQILLIVIPTFAGVLISYIAYYQIFYLDVIVIILVILLLMTFDNKVFSIDNNIQKKSFQEDFFYTFKMIYNNNNFFIFCICAAIINVLGGAIVLSIQVLVVKQLLPKAIIGILFTSSPLGIILGSYISKRLDMKKFKVSKTLVYVAFTGVFNIAMGLAGGNYILFILFYFISGIFFGMSNVYFGILYREMIPNNVQGRFFGFLNSVTTIAIPIGNVITGIILQYVSPSVSLVFLGLLTVTSGMLFSRKFKGKVLSL